jgi:hypothetical protein
MVIEKMTEFGHEQLNDDYDNDNGARCITRFYYLQEKGK